MLERTNKRTFQPTRFGACNQVEDTMTFYQKTLVAAVAIVILGVALAAALISRIGWPHEASQTAQGAQQATWVELEKVTCRWTGTRPSPHLEMFLIESQMAQPRASQCSSRNLASVECSVSLPPNGVFTAFVTVLDASGLSERGDALSGTMSCSSALGAVPVMGPPQRHTATFGGWMPRAH